MDVNLSQPVVLPDLEQQRNIEELSRLVLGIHEEVQREADATAGACGRVSTAEEVEANCDARSDSCQPGLSSSATNPPEGQPFVLPLGVTARNEVYPRTCRKW